MSNLEEAIHFYSKMFGVAVNKRKPGYANFAIDHPPLKLVLFEAPGAPERLNHLGVEVFESEQVTAATDRLKEAGLVDRVEDYPAFLPWCGGTELIRRTDAIP